MDLKDLHDMNILHRDLNGANIFLRKNENSIKLGDLNVSKVDRQILCTHRLELPTN